ncbi:TIGR02300 family protein [Corallococcus sp. H22C18031201]|uniref:TIGR02300 family protein n=1 Tax=Citreicoccus inhibens TaxID=2849499 RepID=UPI000E748385|nr:TIGR02300 family protein [Citreicoccus inhibens]MBU8900672.1 TIGR02300 family protein [Citreicoccus inhibens]RJS25803.1 TIGR02300 family protein [Corallococcus sp. H22C18031201]
MSAKDLGTKFVCFKCSTKFYDMKKPDPVCPKCGADQRESPALKPAPEGRRSRLSAAPKVIEPVEPEEPAASEDEEEDLESFDDDEAGAGEAEEDEI